jgi:TetR/AcrR family transcriptional regulator
MLKKDYRNRLLSTATLLFAERGLNGVSIRELSKAAGVSISMISYYFGGKEALYSAILKEQFSCFDYMEQIINKDSAPLAKIRDYIRWTIKRHRDNPYLLRYYTSELTNPTKYFSTIVQPTIGNAIQMLVEIVEEGISLGEFREELNPVDTVLVMAAMANYYFLSTHATEKFINHSPDRDEELLTNYMDIFTKGIVNQQEKSN